MENDHVDCVVDDECITMLHAYATQNSIFFTNLYVNGGNLSEESKALILSLLPDISQIANDGTICVEYL